MEQALLLALYATIKQEYGTIQRWNAQVHGYGILLDSEIVALREALPDILKRLEHFDTRECSCRWSGTAYCEIHRDEYADVIGG